MPLPAVKGEIYRRRGAHTRFWYLPFQASMRPMNVIEVSELDELCLQIGGCPEQGPIEELAANRAD
jgi:hypothetical protein